MNCLITQEPTRLNGRRWRRLAPVMALASMIVAGVLSPAAARSTTGSHRIVAASRLGVSLTLPTDWQQVSRAKDAPLGMTLGRRSGTNSRSMVRMTIEVLGPMRIGSPQAIARSFACGLTRGHGNLLIQRRDVRYGGVSGVMLLGMPGAQRTVQIVLASHGVVYNVVAVGKALAADQRAALSSLRFVSVARNSPALTMKPMVKPCLRF